MDDPVGMVLHLGRRLEVVNCAYGLTDDCFAEMSLEGPMSGVGRQYQFAAFESGRSVPAFLLWPRMQCRHALHTPSERQVPR